MTRRKRDENVNRVAPRGLRDDNPRGKVVRGEGRGGGGGGGMRGNESKKEKDR